MKVSCTKLKVRKETRLQDKAHGYMFCSKGYSLTDWRNQRITKCSKHSWTRRRGRNSWAGNTGVCKSKITGYRRKRAAKTKWRVGSCEGGNSKKLFLCWTRKRVEQKGQEHNNNSRDLSRDDEEGVSPQITKGKRMRPGLTASVVPHKVSEAI